MSNRKTKLNFQTILLSLFGFVLLWAIVTDAWGYSSNLTVNYGNYIYAVISRLIWVAPAIWLIYRYSDSLTFDKQELFRRPVWNKSRVPFLQGSRNCLQPPAQETFRDGEEWLDELREYLFENRCMSESYISEKIPVLKAIHAEATYLLWIDISGLNKKSSEVASFIRTNTGLYLSDGEAYGKSGEHFLRMNLACSRGVLEDGLLRLRNAAESLKKA